MATSNRSLTRNVLLMYTGGTIGMVPKDIHNPVSELVAGNEQEIRDSIERLMPELGKDAGIRWELQTRDSIPPMDSCNISPSHWAEMARWVKEEYERWDGFVILHGTDTLAYTASALSFMLKNLGKPVVITGAQLPLRDERTDGRSNLANAIRVAAHRSDDAIPLIPEVLVCFGSLLLRGNRTRKVSTTHLTGFNSPNFPPLGRLGERIEIERRLIRPIPNADLEPFEIEAEMESKVMDITLFPGQQAEALKALLSQADLKGVVIRTFGAGNTMTDPGVASAFQDASNAGKLILNVTQCLEGQVEMGLYQTSSHLMEAGVVSGLDLTPEAALCKLMWALATFDIAEAREQLQINQRGEQSKSIFELRYPACGGFASRHYLTAHPSGQYRKEHLVRALLQVRSLEFQAEADGPLKRGGTCAAFLGLQRASQVSDRQDSHCVFTVRATGEIDDPNPQAWDVTRQVQPIPEAHEIALTLDCDNQVACRFSEASMHLFVNSE